jgi:hypothetical protein
MLAFSSDVRHVQPIHFDLRGPDSPNRPFARTTLVPDSTPPCRPLITDTLWRGNVVLCRGETRIPAQGLPRMPFDSPV